MKGRQERQAKDMYMVICPSCGWNHYEPLMEDPGDNEIEVLCHKCSPKDNERGEFSF